MSKGIVLVTGASGYIASFVIKALLADGWTVRGTVRNLAKGAAVRAALGVGEAELPLVAADLGSDAGWAEAAAGCDFVQHIASPLPSAAVRSDDEMIIPARDGALRVVKAASAAGVRRIVMTSSIAAMYYGQPGRVRRFSEADWSNLASPETTAYAKSKTIAERAARDWIAANGTGIEFCTINPGLVLGPVLGREPSVTLEVIARMLAGTLPGLPRIGFALCDVRDIAAAHVAAMTLPDMAGERFLCAGEFLWMADIAAVLKTRLADQARRVPTLVLPDFFLRLAALFDREIRLLLPEIGLTVIGDDSHARARIGWAPRPATESIVDTARSLIAAGLVKR